MIAVTSSSSLHAASQNGATVVSRTFVVVAILLGAGCSIPMAPHGGSGSEVGKIHDAASTPADATLPMLVCHRCAGIGCRAIHRVGRCQAVIVISDWIGCGRRKVVLDPVERLLDALTRGIGRLEHGIAGGGGVGCVGDRAIRIRSGIGEVQRVAGNTCAGITTTCRACGRYNNHRSIMRANSVAYVPGNYRCIFN